MQGLLQTQQYEALAAPREAALIIEVAKTFSAHLGHQTSISCIRPDNELWLEGK